VLRTYGKGKKGYLALAAILVLAALVAGCGSSGSSSDAGGAEGGGAEGGEGGGLKVALILPGRINDKGWDTIAYNGLQEAKKDLGVEVAYAETIGPSEEEAQFQSYASQGYDVVLGMGGQYTAGAEAAAEQFPEVLFGVIGGNEGNGSNLASFNARQEQVFYLSGVLAAEMSKTKTIAYMSGSKVDNVLRGAAGFKQGVEAADPSATLREIWTGDFEDVNKAEQATAAAFDQGADVVQVNSNAANIGAIQAAQKSGNLAIGVYGDLTSFGPTAVATNVIPAMNTVLVKAIEQAQGEEWGEFYLYGFEQIPKLAQFTPMNEQALGAAKAKELSQILSKTEAEMRSGKIKVQEP
jgi:basic membrane protein A